MESKLLRKLRSFLQQDARDDSGWTSLHWASQANCWKLVDELTEEYLCDVDAVNQAGCTPLLVACWHGHDLTARALIANGADVNVTDSQGCTPLCVACYRGHEPLVETLLRANAVHENVIRSKTLTTLKRHGLISNGVSISREDTLPSALCGMCLDVLGSALVKPQQKRMDGKETTLALACGRGYHRDVEKELAEAGEEVGITVRDAMGWTPLHWASQHGNVEIIELLLKHQCTPVNAAGTDGRTALYVACQNSHENVALALLERGTTDKADLNGMTALDMAAARGLCGVVQGILRGKPVSAAAPWSRWTPLHWAAQGGRRQVVRQLVQHGLEADAIAQGGLTPLHIASFLGHLDVVKELVDCGADVSIANAEDWTALQFARKGNWIDVLEYLSMLPRGHTGPKPAALALSSGTPSSGDHHQ